MRAFVTGASGFLGHAVCEELRSGGHAVVALVRRPGSEPEGTQPVAGDLSDGEVLRRMVAEARPDWVIHMAAEIATQRDADKIEEVNVSGTRRLLEACAAAGRPRFVFVSTVVTGDAGGAVLDESAALPVETAYGRSKQEGERLVGESGLPSVIIRPSHVYGAGGWYPGEAADGALYHVVDDAPIRYYDFVALTARALGVGAPRRVPERLARLVGGRDPVAAVVRSARGSNVRIKRELGWAPRYPSAQAGVPDAVRRLQASSAA